MHSILLNKNLHISILLGLGKWDSNPCLFFPINSLKCYMAIIFIYETAACQIFRFHTLQNLKHWLLLMTSNINRVKEQISWKENLAELAVFNLADDKIK